MIIASQQATTWFSLIGQTSKPITITCPNSGNLKYCSVSTAVSSVWATASATSTLTGIFTLISNASGTCTKLGLGALVCTDSKAAYDSSVSTSMTCSYTFADATTDTTGTYNVIASTATTTTTMVITGAWKLAGFGIAAAIAGMMI